jgi:hypothetical protein
MHKNVFLGLPTVFIVFCVLSFFTFLLFFCLSRAFFAIKNVAQLRSCVRDHSENTINEHLGVHSRLWVPKVGSPAAVMTLYIGKNRLFANGLASFFLIKTQKNVFSYHRFHQLCTPNLGTVQYAAAVLARHFETWWPRVRSPVYSMPRY